MKKNICLTAVLCIFLPFAAGAWELFDRVIAVVNDRPIMASEVNERFEKYKKIKNIPVAKISFHKSRVLDTFIEDSIFEQVAEEESIIVSKEKVDDHIEKTMKRYNIDSLKEFKEKLEKKGLEWYLKNFKVTDQMLSELVALGMRNKVKPDYHEMRNKKAQFQIHVKAQIARKLWGNRGMYPVLNETNEILKQSLKLFDKMPEVLKTGNL